MFEKVNPMHPDKIADRIAGAIVDLAYQLEKNPKIAVEVLLGHGKCFIICESSLRIKDVEIKKIVKRIAGDMSLKIQQHQQDIHLADNQKNNIRCADNGIFRGLPLTEEQLKLTEISKNIFEKYNTDGKYLLDNNKLVICQSNAKTADLIRMYPNAIINPLGEWSGGTDVDCGATNRKLGSDMADSATGGGLHGKDLSKADVSINIYAFLKAQKEQKRIEISCAIGDEIIDGKSYIEIVDFAKEYIKSIGGFEKFAEWGLVR